MFGTPAVRPRFRRRRLLALSAALLLGSTALVDASLAPAIALDPDSGPVGAVIEVTGSGFPDQTGSLHLDDLAGDPLVSGIDISAGGAFEASFAIPQGTSLGDHIVIACHESAAAGRQCPGRAPLTVTVPATTTSTTTTRPVGVSTTSSSTTSSSTTTLPLGASTTTSPDPTAPTAPGEVASPTTTTTLGLGVGEQPDLFVTGIEVTQTIQNLDNEMPLVARRLTIARVSVKSQAGALNAVSGVMQVSRGGKEVAIVHPVNGPITATSAGSDRLDHDGTLNFVLPPEAVTTSKKTKLRVFVYNSHPQAPFKQEPTAANNFFSEFVGFQTGADLAIRFFPIHTHNPVSPAAPETTFGGTFADALTVAEMMVAAYRYLPVAEIIPLPGTKVFPPKHGVAKLGDIALGPNEFNPGTKSGGGYINSVLYDLWEQNTPADEYEQFYGLIAAEQPMAYGGLSNYTVAHGTTSTSLDEESPWYHGTGGKSMAHELAHNVDFKHNKCKGDEDKGGATEPYPYTGPPCRLAPLDPDGWFGFDLVWQSLVYLDHPEVISNDPNLPEPNRAWPVMGYKNPRWADPYFYCRQLEHFGIDCTAMSIPENQVDYPDDLPELAIDPYDSEAPGQDGWLKVSAAIDTATGVAELVDTRRVPEPSPRVLDELARRRASGEPTGFTVELAGPGGEPVAPPLELVNTTHYDELGEAEPEPTQILVEDYIPWVGDPATVQVRNGDDVVSTRAISPNPPTIDVTAPTGGQYDGPVEVTWDASDPDGDDLWFTVSYSPDGGESWTVLARYIEESSFTVESFDGVPGGDEAIFRVEATDGVRVAADLSEPGVVAPGAPVVTLTSPGDGATFPMYQPVALQASAWDWEDGMDQRPVVSWSSSLDGDLGEGSLVLASDLSAGEHTITATATDSSGQTASAEVSIVVDEDTALPRPQGAAGDDLLRAVRTGNLSDDGTSAWIYALGAAIVLAVAGGFVLRRRAGRSSAEES